MQNRSFSAALKLNLQLSTPDKFEQDLAQESVSVYEGKLNALVQQNYLISAIIKQDGLNGTIHINGSKYILSSSNVSHKQKRIIFKGSLYLDKKKGNEKFRFISNVLKHVLEDSLKLESEESVGSFTLELFDIENSVDLTSLNQLLM